MEIRSVPLQELPTAEETVPKRGRGRPPKIDPITGERVNKPRGSGGGSTARKPSSSRSLETQIGALLTTVNVVVMMVPPIAPDALDVAEITALAKAMDAQCKQSPRFRKYVEGMLAAGSGGQLLGVVAIIAARRASRHGLAPAEIDPMLGGMLAGNTDAIGQTYTPPEPKPIDPDTGETQPKPFDFEDTIRGA